MFSAIRKKTFRQGGQAGRLIAYLGLFNFPFDQSLSFSHVSSYFSNSAT